MTVVVDLTTECWRRNDNEFSNSTSEIHPTVIAIIVARVTVSNDYSNNFREKFDDRRSIITVLDVNYRA